MRPKVRKGIERGVPRVEETQEQGKRQDHGQRETGSCCAPRVIWFHRRSLSGKLRPIQDSRKACGFREVAHPARKQLLQSLPSGPTGATTRRMMQISPWPIETFRLQQLARFRLVLIAGHAWPLSLEIGAAGAIAPLRALNWQKPRCCLQRAPDGRKDDRAEPRRGAPLGKSGANPPCPKMTGPA